MTIRGSPATELFVVQDWMAIYYEADGELYLCSVWNSSAAYYDVLIHLTPEEAHRCRTEGADYMVSLARFAINNSGFRDRLIKDYSN